MAMIFVNLPVRDVQASRAFFGALGFGFNDQFSDEQTACLVIDDGHSYAMLLEEPRFRGFINGEIADPESTEVLLALSADSREAVDDMLAKALEAGATEWKPTEDQGFMYGASFRDVDGHVWELVWMDPAAVAGES
jgi:predicted lactoylglutathione lyase